MPSSPWTGAQGWGSYGFAETSGDLQEVTLSYSEGPLATLADGHGCVPLDSAECADLCARMGATSGAEGLLVPFILRDRLAAALYVDRSADDAPLSRRSVQLLAYIGAQAVEGLALRQRSETPTLQVAAGPVETPGVALWESPPAEPAAVAPVVEPEPEPVAAEPEPPAAEPEPPALEPELPITEAAGAPAVDEAATIEPAVEPPSLEPPSAEPPTIDEEPPSLEPTAVEPPAAEPPAFEPAGAEPVLSELQLSEPQLTEPAALPTEPPAEPPAEEAPEDESPAGGVTQAIPVMQPAIDTTVDEEFEVPAEPMAEPPAAAAEPDLETPLEAPAQPSGSPLEPAPEEPAEEPQPWAETAGAELSSIEADTPPETIEVLPPTDSTPTGGGTTEVRPPTDVSGPGWAFTASRASAETGDDAQHEEARRLARLLVTEIKLYNEEQVEEGRRSNDIYARLREDIDRSRQIFNERVDEAVRQETDYFHEEMVRILGGGNAEALGV
jgi:hypothetical protein